MSGGSYNYAFQQMRDFADSLQCSTPERTAFKAHCYKVAEAMRAIEWVDSCDNSRGEETPAIMKCIQYQDVLKQAIVDAEATQKSLTDVITLAKEHVGS